MASRPPSPRVTRSAATIGEQLGAWRRLQGLTAQQVADRAGVSRGTITKIEAGDLGVRFGAVLAVARSLDVLDAVVKATDPYETDLGRARADQVLPKRVRP
ncbi:helix-turn-helix domain-containing protein [Microbacterium sp.]|uniref:helix-turn-helix domain-containing protein n=1 Tax=Microbacterium sp. TaxID=51671 RepID=UPI003A92FB5C